MPGVIIIEKSHRKTTHVSARLMVRFVIITMAKKGKIAASRWYRLIPVVFITYSLAYLDRANFGFGAAAGMARDLHISATISSLLGSMFFLGYFFFQIPGTLYAASRSARKLIF